MQGHLIALSDESSTPEDVMYYFIRSLSILDFSTAQRYSKESSVVSSYIDYYSEISDSITDYYANFLRKQYKTSITSLEVISVADTADFEDGEMLITVNVRVLDLTDKGESMLCFRGFGKRSAIVPAAADDILRRGDRKVVIERITWEPLWNYLKNNN